MEQSTQDLLDYLNSELVQYDNQIAEQQTMKTNIDAAISQQEQNILQLQAQKAQLYQSSKLSTLTGRLVVRMVLQPESQKTRKRGTLPQTPFVCPPQWRQIR